MAVSPNYEASKRNMLRSRAKTSGPAIVALRLRRAARAGEFPDLGLGDYYRVADGCCAAVVEASDDELDSLVAYSTGRMMSSDLRAEAHAMFESRLASKLQGPFIDLIAQLLPILIPLISGCFS